MKNFALIGLAGFVAKKHVKCIKDIKGNLVSTLDLHDNVGFIDSFFPKCEFFTSENLFFRFIKKKNIDFVVICSPSHLHYKHIKLSLKAGCNVIVEKPPVLSLNQYREIIKIEAITKKKCHCIFQLRLDRKLKNLKTIVDNSDSKYEVEIIYYSYRGNWYFKSWKNKKMLSGGLLINIAIHFFDILMWIFGEVKKIQVTNRNKSRVKGFIELEKANVKWIVSVENIKKQNNKIKTRYYRIMKVNNKIINFDKFNDLHFSNYLEILKGNFHISEFEDVIKFLPKLK